MPKTLSELNKSLANWAVKETVNMQRDLFDGIQRDTPVNTGKARAGWQSEEVQRLGDTGLVKNDVEYIGWLEFGSDTVAPSAMVRTNIKRVTIK